MSGFYWLTSYPKSGNTWMRLALSCLMHGWSAPDFDLGHNGFAANACQRADLDSTLDVESSDMTPEDTEALRPTTYRLMAAASRTPLYRKVHDAWTLTATGEPLFPPEVTLGTIYIVRDPRDVAVSWSHFSGLDLDSIISIMCDPNAILANPKGGAVDNLPQRLLCWSGHVRSWLNAPGSPPCVLRYEDMLADPIGALRRAGECAGLPTDPHSVGQAVAATRFDTLKAREAEQGFAGGQRRGGTFFRGGRSGDWKTALTTDQTARLCHAHKEMMEHFCYA